MNPALLVRLRPTGPWRIGPDSGARDRVDRIYHSDSLYSAVSSAMARLGLLDEWLERPLPRRAIRGPAQLVFSAAARSALRHPAAQFVAAAAVRPGSLEGRAIRPAQAGGSTTRGQAGQRRRLDRGWRERVPGTLGSGRRGTFSDFRANQRRRRPPDRRRAAALDRVPGIRAGRGVVVHRCVCRRGRSRAMVGAAPGRVATAGRFRLRRRAFARVGPGRGARVRGRELSGMPVARAC